MPAYNKKEKLQIEISNLRYEGEHFHQNIELLFVLEGTLDADVGNQAAHMKSQDILVINANKKHSLSGSEDALYVRLYIDYNLMADVFESMNIFLWCDSTRDSSGRYDELRSVIKQLLNHHLSTHGRADFGHIALCYRVMELLSVHFLVRSGDKVPLEDQDRFEDRISQINNYIRANYNQPISTKELSEKLYLSNGYLSRFFKKNYGMSFADYLTNVRVFHAVDDLLNTNTPITRVAYDNGFPSAANFNKAFKEIHGETPSAFRKKSRERADEKSEDDPTLSQRLEIFLRNDGQKQEESRTAQSGKARYSAGKYEKIIPFWKDMINAGSAEDLLKSDVREHIVYLKENFGFQYVRFWSLFSEEMLITNFHKGGAHNYSRLDSILDFLLEHGIKPHIELGMKPRRVNRNVQDFLIQEEKWERFPGLVNWENEMDSLMRHLIHRYGRREVGTWRMELWCREHFPDRKTGVEEYLAQFEATERIIHRYSTALRFGGCGARIDFLEQYGKAIFKNWYDRKVRIDFLSFIYYAYERGEEDQDRYSKRITDNEAILHYIQKTERLLEAVGFEGVPILATEWNLTVSDRNYINDTCFKGAYLVKNMIDVYGMAESMAYFLGSDRVSEHYDSDGLLYGGTGLLTKDGIKKPAAYAFDFMNRLYPYFIGKGRNYLITTDGTEIYGIVCHNQKKLNYNYYLSREDELDKKNIWKYFEERDVLDLEILLTDLADGMYQIKTYRINEHDGSVMDYWEEMEFENEITRNDIKYLSKKCEPRLTIRKVQVSDGTLAVKLRMEANEIAFIKARRLV